MQLHTQHLRESVLESLASEENSCQQALRPYKLLPSVTVVRVVVGPVEAPIIEVRWGSG